MSKLFLVLLLAACTAHAAPPAAIVPGIPYPIEAAGGALLPDASSAGLELAAARGTDLYVNADGSKVADNTPRLLFRPVGDFIFSAKVTAVFQREFDGAALIVYGGRTQWIKLLFERARTGKLGVSSTVAKGVGDDAHHGEVSGNTVYLKVARLKDLYVFYTSPDGVRWSMVRNVGMSSETPLQVGFSVQSPVGERFSARFSDIVFRPQSFKDFWQGE